MLWNYKAFWKSFVINLAVTAVWYWTEYRQFGALQWDRKCDNLIGVIYFVVIWYFIHRVQSLESQVNKKGKVDKDVED